MSPTWTGIFVVSLDLSMHYKNLYELSLARKTMCYRSLSHMSPFFTIGDIYIGLKKLASRKESDLQCIKTEMLKWMRKETHAWISDIFNYALQHVIPYDCTSHESR